jgi:hypothetical protein
MPVVGEPTIQGHVASDHFALSVLFVSYAPYSVHFLGDDEQAE